MPYTANNAIGGGLIAGFLCIAFLRLLDSNDLKKSSSGPIFKNCECDPFDSFTDDLNVVIYILSYNPGRRLGFSYGYCIFEAFWTVVTLKTALLDQFFQNCEYDHFDSFY